MAPLFEAGGGLLLRCSICAQVDDCRTVATLAPHAHIPYVMENLPLSTTRKARVRQPKAGPTQSGQPCQARPSLTQPGAPHQKHQPGAYISIRPDYMISKMTGDSVGRPDKKRDGYDGVAPRPATRGSRPARRTTRTAAELIDS